MEEMKLQQGLLATYLIPGRDRSGVRLGSESSSGGDVFSGKGELKAGRTREAKSKDIHKK